MRNLPLVATLALTLTESVNLAPLSPTWKTASKPSTNHRANKTSKKRRKAQKAARRANRS